MRRQPTLPILTRPINGRADRKSKTAKPLKFSSPAAAVKSRLEPMDWSDFAVEIGAQRSYRSVDPPVIQAPGPKGGR
jgi:hypothetical protein